MFTFNTYLSSFTWRYGSDEMRRIFSEQHKYQLWRKIWASLAKAQHKAGLISSEELEDLLQQQGNIDINQILENEKTTKHDVVAAIKEFAEKATIGGGKIHLGATSMDIVDNTDAIRIHEALKLIEKKLIKLLSTFSTQIEKYADLTCIGYTHLQSAEPTTVGYRLSVYAQDLLTDYRFLQFVLSNIKGKGMKGAVGTAASYTTLLTDAGDFEEQVMKELDIEPSVIATQVYSRKYDYLALSVLSSICSTLAKFAADLRLLQSPGIGEWSEPFGKDQVGSSAMPFKRNPINAEKICSLARYVSILPNVAVENASHSYLERTLDDSANKRIIIPESFLATDEILNVAEKIISGLVVYEKKVAYNVTQYGSFAATEAILVEMVRQGANRQQMHEVLRDISMEAWIDVQEGKKNPMEDLLIKNKEIFLKKEKIQELMDVRHHIGNASERAIKLVEEIEKVLNEK